MEIDVPHTNQEFVCDSVPNNLISEFVYEINRAYDTDHDESLNIICSFEHLDMRLRGIEVPQNELALDDIEVG